MEDNADKSAPILKCPTCGKIFTNEKTKRRHRFYCRSKLSKGPQAPPKRSCTACVRAKVRCDIHPGKCARCELRGLQCEWHPGTGYVPSAESSSSQHDDQVNKDTVDLVPEPVSIRNPDIDDIDTEMNDESMSSLLSEEDNMKAYASTSSQSLRGDLSFPKSIEPAVNTDPNLLDGKQLDLRTISSRLAEYGAPFQSFQFTTASGSLTRLPQQVSTQNEWRAFQYRNFSNPLQRQSAATLSLFLSSYPTMMLRQETFPPYIHPQCALHPGENAPLLKPLARCMELAHSFKMRTRENSDVVWKDIRLERERLWTERTKYSKWELLAALQSLVMFAIMRLVEGEKDYTDFDALLLVSINLMCSQITDTVGGLVLPEEDSQTEFPWNEWLFAESRRRTLSLYRVISIFMNLDTAKPCRPLPDFLDAPLPAPKTVWSAQNESAWKQEYQRYLNQTGGNFLTNGKLILMHAGNNREAGWDDWFAGIDGIGSLMVIATSMLV